MNLRFLSVFVAAGLLAGAISSPSTAAPAARAQPTAQSGLGCLVTTDLVIELDAGGPAAAQAAADTLSGIDDPCAGPVEVVAADGTVATPSDEAQQMSAAAANVNGYKTFTLRSPDFRVSNSHGTYTAQVRYASAARSMQFSFFLSGGLRSIATGPVTHTQTRSPGNCHYSKVQSAAYSFHWSCPSQTVNKRYDMNGVLTFRVSVHGAPGTARVTTSFGYVVTNAAS